MICLPDLAVGSRSNRTQVLVPFGYFPLGLVKLCPVVMRLCGLVLARFGHDRHAPSNQSMRIEKSDRFIRKYSEISRKIFNKELPLIYSIINLSDESPLEQRATCAATLVPRSSLEIL